MRPFERKVTSTTIAELERVGFDLATEIKAHLVDTDARIVAEQAKNKPSKVILESLLKEREQMLLAIVPYQFQKPEKEVVVEEEDTSGITRAIKLTF